MKKHAMCNLGREKKKTNITQLEKCSRLYHPSTQHPNSTQSNIQELDL
jgi:hypothetical protein